MPDDTKTWTVIGTSVQRGERTLRLANGLAADRQRVLEKAGCTEIRLFDLPRPMRREEAIAWLEAQGDAVPEQRQREERPAATPRERTVKRLAAELMAKAQVDLPYEELGRAHHAKSFLRFMRWEESSIEVRQEHCRNAAREHGLPTPRGMFPELEAFLARDGLRVEADGTLTERGRQAA